MLPGWAFRALVEDGEYLEALHWLPSVSGTMQIPRHPGQCPGYGFFDLPAVQ